MARGDVLLVGSVPLADAEAVFTTCGHALGDHLASLPDGETGDRRIWIVYQAYRVFDGHPQLETVQRPRGLADEPWIPAGLDDLWQFKVRPGAGPLHFETLRYADDAIASYARFQALRAAGGLPAGLRFQVCLPTPVGVCGVFFPDLATRPAVEAAYADAMGRELDRLCAAVPGSDLAVQWDVCTELMEIEGVFPAPGDPWQRYEQALGALLGRVPADALLGYHFCYADLGHRHMVEPKHLGLCVRMANAAVARSGRRVDWVHMPVPRDRTDDAYFAPLAGLATGGTRVYLGLVHHSDGLAGARARIATARRHLSGFGIATECGFGRRPPAQVPELLNLHREALALL